MQLIASVAFFFRQDPVDDKFGHTTFTKEGYNTWKNAYKGLPLHVGGARSIHYQARIAYEDFKNQRSSLKHKVTTYSKESLVKYETCFDTSLGIISYLALQGEPFHGHDEPVCSMNKGNFLEMLDWYKERKSSRLSRLLSVGYFKRKQKNPQAHGYRCSFHL